jgi:hypothetical protein
MDVPGLRYRLLATRCRQSAELALKPEDRSALLRMAEGYEQRALATEREWERRTLSENQVEFLADG